MFGKNPLGLLCLFASGASLCFLAFVEAHPFGLAIPKDELQNPTEKTVLKFIETLSLIEPNQIYAAAERLDGYFWERSASFNHHLLDNTLDVAFRKIILDVMHAVHASDDDSLRSISRIIHDNDAPLSLRKRAVHVFAAIAPQTQLATLHPLLKSGDEELVADTLSILGETKDKSLYEWFSPFLHPPVDARMRIIALRALINAGDRRIVPILRALSRTSSHKRTGNASGSLKKLSLAGLGAFSDWASVPSILQSLSSSDPEMRFSSALLLSSLPDWPKPQRSSPRVAGVLAEFKIEKLVDILGDFLQKERHPGARIGFAFSLYRLQPSDDLKKRILKILDSRYVNTIAQSWCIDALKSFPHVDFYEALRALASKMDRLGLNPEEGKPRIKLAEAIHAGLSPSESLCGFPSCPLVRASQPGVSSGMVS